MNIISQKWRSRKTFRDLVIVCFTAIFIFIIASLFNFYERIQSFSQNHERWQVGGLFTLIIALFFALIIFSILRWRELSHEIIEHNRAKEQIKLNEARLQSLHSIFQHKSKELGIVLDHVLDEAIHLTGSKIGWFGFYEEENKTLTVSNWSKEVLKECEIHEKQVVFPVEDAGIWAEGIRLRKPFIVNNYQTFGLGKRGYPEGHAKVFKFLTIPLLMEDRIIAAMAVANKIQDYDETDILQLTLLMDSVLKLIEQKLAEKALHKKEEEAKRLVQEDAVVAEIGRIISSTLNIEDVYERFVEKVREIIPFDRIAINDINSRDNTITPAYVTGLTVLERPTGKAFSLAGTFSDKVLQTHKSMLIHGEDLKKTTDKFPQFVPIFQAGIRSLIIIPLISNDEVIGILQIQSTNSKVYSLRDLSLAEKVGHQIAGAIANAQLFTEQKKVEEALQKSEKEAKRLAQENAIMAEIGRIITSTLNIEEVYDRFSEEVLKLIPFDRIAVNLHNPKENTITITYSTGLDVLHRGSGDTIPFAGSAAGECIRTRSSLLLQADQIDKVASQFPMLLPTFQSGVQSLLFVPLISKDQVIGALFLRASKINKYTEEDLRLAERVANQIAGAIANAQLFTEQKRAEEALLKSQQMLEKTFGSLREAVFIIDANTVKIIDCNPAASKIFGYSLEEMKGRTTTFLHLDEAALDEFRTHLHPAIKEKGFLFLPEFRMRRKDGTIFYSEHSVMPLEDQQGNHIGWVSVVRDITEHKQTEEALRKSEERFRQLFNYAPIAYHEFDTEGRITRVNQTELEMLGYTEEEMLGRPVWDFLTETVWIEALKKRLTGELPAGQVLERTFRRKDGTIFPALIHERLIRDDEGKIIGIRSTIQDITELKKTEERMNTLQEQLRQSQKMEAIGRLAGGIAHDFNNLLTVIKGYSQLSFFELKEGDPLRGNIDEIQKASQRASDLTHQLLAFSRRQILEFMVFNLNTILRDLDKMLHRIIGEDIELVYLLSDNLSKIKTDPVQIEQVILNLAVNARDAMPSGGKLTIETANVFLDESYTHSHADVKPGPYVMLSVTDTGCGMSQEVKERVFEPFFTTKEKGIGTGLGLSTVYGIVKQSGGDIWFYSEEGMGTTFKIYLPNVDEIPTELKEKEMEGELPLGNETILVVEDELSVRDLAARVLERQGYELLEASNGNEALRLVQEYAGEKIDLLLTDVVMPGMSGSELADRLRSSHAEARVLYMSGYTNNSIVHHGILEPGISFLQKPFSPEALARKVREVLDDQ
jgi:two-component system cell cycle sensor histidine kinase/response regulator CckA